MAIVTALTKNQISAHNLFEAKCLLSRYIGISEDRLVTDKERKSKLPVKGEDFEGVKTLLATLAGIEWNKNLETVFSRLTPEDVQKAEEYLYDAMNPYYFITLEEYEESMGQEDEEYEEDGIMDEEDRRYAEEIAQWEEDGIAAVELQDETEEL